MPVKDPGKSNKVLKIIIFAAIIIAAVIIGLTILRKPPAVQVAEKPAEKVHVPVEPQAVIDYGKIEKDAELKAMMQERKAKYGIEKGLDIIAKPNESIKIGDLTVPMQEILDKIRLKRGDVIEKDLANKYGAKTARQDAAGASKDKIEAYGIYVVQPENNIWNIHFKFLKDYFDHKGIALSPLADEPDRSGRSSGVGKLLKFSENMVFIYNLRERKLDADLNLIHPLSKIVVFNMGQVFSLLDHIDYTHVNRIQFDGETLWIPAEQ